MMLAVVITLSLLVVIGLAIGGNLSRIASALEEQNDHYGIGKKTDES